MGIGVYGVSRGGRSHTVTQPKAIVGRQLKGLEGVGGLENPTWFSFEKPAKRTNKRRRSLRWPVFRKKEWTSSAGKTSSLNGEKATVGEREGEM